MSEFPQADKLHVLTELVRTIDQRRQAQAGESYTATLLTKGIEHCAKKFGEEAVELALASIGQDRQHFCNEAADVIYHLLVLLSAGDIKFDEVLDELERRFAMSGIAEKAARKPR